MRKFKHKALGWIAENVDQDEPCNYQATNMHIVVIPKLTIEYLTHSSDREEEIVEKDWIEQCYYGKKYNAQIPYLVPLEEFREDIEEYVPKFKFTEEEVSQWNAINRAFVYNTLCKFLKDHGLLSTD